MNQNEIFAAYADVFAKLVYATGEEREMLLDSLVWEAQFEDEFSIKQLLQALPARIIDDSWDDFTDKLTDAESLVGGSIYEFSGDVIRFRTEHYARSCHVDTTYTDLPVRVIRLGYDAIKEYLQGEEERKTQKRIRKEQEEKERKARQKEEYDRKEYERLKNKFS